MIVIIATISLVTGNDLAIGERFTGYLADRALGDYTCAYLPLTIAAAFALLAMLAIFALARDGKVNIVK